MGTVITKVIKTKLSDKKEDIKASSYREYKELKEKRKLYNFSKKMNNIKYKVERGVKFFQ